MLSDTQNQILIARLTRTEGRRLKPYVDTVGKITIGVGRNLTDDGITSDECDMLLRNDLASASEDAVKIPVFLNLDPIRQTVLVDMVFNMGLDSVKEFVNTLTS